MSILSIIFAILGLSFLIFIHELGHYIMAKKAGMKIEVFSIGMGKPIISWKQNGVKWQICYLIFGGYVKIAGMEAEGGKEAHQIRGGFYSKKPLYRLLVAGAGPFVNIVFALLIFSVIYFCGGESKPFSQYTKVIGRVDKTSQAYEEGIRAGDTIVSINDDSYHGFRDVLMQGMKQNDKQANVQISTRNNEIIDTNLHLYSPVEASLSSRLPKEWKSLGFEAPASYMVTDGFAEGKEENAPLAGSTLKKGDRVVYVDGEIIYSTAQFSDIINSDIALITVDRNGKKIHLQVPRVLLGDLKLSAAQKDEFIDYKREMNLEGALASTYYIPYFVSDGLYVEDQILFIEDETDSNQQAVLKSGDKILAVAGEEVSTAEEFYQAVAERKCLVMVSNQKITEVSWTDCDKEFFAALDMQAIASMEANIGDDISKTSGSYRFLKQTKPMSYGRYYEKADPKTLEEVKATLDSDTFTKFSNRLTLFSGVNFKEENVIYNPGPFAQASDVVVEIGSSLKNIFTGNISPKHMSGPIGIVKHVHDGTKSSPLTGLYWLGMISLNLGCMNLLPLPVLDGGHICFTIYEMITKKRIKAKTMQMMLVPCVVLLISFFAYITFYDLIKVFG